MREWNELNDEEKDNVLRSYNSGKEEDRLQIKDKEPAVFDKYDADYSEEFSIDNLNKNYVQYDFSNGSVAAYVDDVDFGDNTVDEVYSIIEYKDSDGDDITKEQFLELCPEIDSSDSNIIEKDIQKILKERFISNMESF